MNFNSKVEVFVYGAPESKVFSKQVKNFAWEILVITRASVGAQWSARVSPQVLQLTYSKEVGDDDIEEDMELDLKDFKASYEYQSNGSNSLGVGLHLVEVEINLTSKEVLYSFATNSF